MTGGQETLERDEQGELTGRTAARPVAADPPADAEQADRDPIDRAASPGSGDSPGPMPAHRLVEPARDRERLHEYLVEGLGTSRSRPQDGTEVRVRLEPADIERARQILTAFARCPGVYDPLALAATSLDVALQDLLQFVREYTAPVTVSLDRWDCALVQFAVAAVLGRDSDDGDLTLTSSGAFGSDRPGLPQPH